MATVTHIIRSHYDPADRERLERETGQRTDTDDAGLSDPWQTESSFSAHRRIRAPPTFVPATTSYDEWGAPIPSRSSMSDTSTATGAGAGTESRAPAHPSTSSAAWYRALTATAATKPPREPVIAGISPAQPPPSPSPPLRSSSAPTPSASSTVTCASDGDALPDTHARPPRVHRPTIRDWFIHNALRSDPSLVHTHVRPRGSGPNGAPSLADLLARDPPPLPGESRYMPPVWLHIGPSNRGFGMLQRRGWQEGEGLGAHVIRREDTAASLPIKVEDYAERIDQVHEVIDLTRSDSEVSEDEVAFEEVVAVGSDSAETEIATNRNGDTDTPTSHLPISLLTPLPTVLKADRLGIGLKAKTEGPYRQSKKRVTHNAAALAAHIRAAEDMRRKKEEVGRGRRGFSKANKREEDRRKKMLAYLNE